MSDDPTGLCAACGYEVPAETYAIGQARILVCGACGLGITRPIPAAAIDPVHAYDHSLWTESVRRLEDFRRYAGPVIAAVKQRVRGGRLLEIGSNVGAALTVARDEGFAAEGLEVNPDAARYARETLGIPTQCATLEEAELARASYDAIVASHVMEHIVDLKVALARIRTLLKPGGIFLLVSPCHRSIMARIQRQSWDGWKVDQHVWHLTAPSARLLLRGAGFDGVETWASANLDHPIPPGAKGVLKRAVLRLAQALDQADQVFAAGRTGP